MTEFINTRELIGDNETLEGLISHTLEEFNEDGLTSIRGQAFYKNIGLKKVNMPMLASISSGAFGDCSCLAIVNTPLVKKISSNAFTNCHDLTLINAPLVEDIQSSCFSNCRNLTSIITPELTKIGQYAFNNSGIAILDLSKIVQIDSYAFSNSTLTHLIIRNEEVVPLSKTNIFDNTPISNDIYGSIYVPENLVESYKTAPNWNTYANKIYSIDDYPRTKFGSITDSWDEIFEAEDNETYTSKYSIGDTKTLAIGGRLINMQIVAMNRDLLSDNSGTAKITWICKDIYIEIPFNSSGMPNVLEQSDIYNYLQNQVYNKIDNNIKNRIVQVKKYRYFDSSSSLKNEYIWIPSFKEIASAGTSVPTDEAAGITYSDFFSDSNSRKKTYNGSTTSWWLSTRAANSTVRFVGYQQIINTTKYLSDAHGLVFGFCT